MSQAQFVRLSVRRKKVYKDLTLPGLIVYNNSSLRESFFSVFFVFEQLHAERCRLITYTTTT